MEVTHDQAVDFCRIFDDDGNGNTHTSKAMDLSVLILLCVFTIAPCVGSLGDKQLPLARVVD
jgi:hypothetical protein